MVNTTALTPDDVWGRVRAFAEDAARRRQPIHTLVHRVANVITDVGPDSIGRRSARGRTFRARVTKAKVAAAWRALSRGDQPPRGTLTFTRALMVEALPDLVEHRGGGMIALRHPGGVVTRDR